jgi:hypothetical protein
MKRLYYLTDNIEAAEQLSERLHKDGIIDWNFHVLGREKLLLLSTNFIVQRLCKS